ncbi:MAG TPA: hypothetical protein VHX60_04900 [Acidobacteriaceae bacterium]|jgi:hypothetical protein|nr:hypothetical protein [Acidobacteriaceae bacterium]
MKYDAIDNVVGCGYAEREAAFLYIVAVHSGYFLRRQFNRFVARERGAIATHFLRKAAEQGHVAEMPCADGRHIYHLCGKQVYRMVGVGASQSRRVKSSREVLRRLMALDYVLAHLDRERFVETADAKRQVFAQLKIAPSGVCRTEEFAHAVPVSLAGETESPTIRLAFLDEGQRSVSMFTRFLATHKELLCGLPSAEVVYVAASPVPFSQAQHVFERHMPLRNAVGSACPHGVEHLVHWLEVQHSFHHGHGSMAPAEHQLFLEGLTIYRAPVHLGLVASWKSGAMDAGKVRRLFGAGQHRVSFVTELLGTDYPRSIDPTAGYTAGCDDPQKCLFSNDLQEGEAMISKSRGRERPRPAGLPLSLVVPALSRDESSTRTATGQTKYRRSTRHEQTEDRKRSEPGPSRAAENHHRRYGCGRHRAAV